MTEEIRKVLLLKEILYSREREKRNVWTTKTPRKKKYNSIDDYLYNRVFASSVLKTHF